MKKRLRKKKRVGEFVEWGTLIRAQLDLKSEQELDKFSDEFIEKVENLKCYCGGGISLDKGLDIVVELGKDKQKALSRLNELELWLASDTRVKNFIAVGSKVSGKSDKVFDLWHGDPENSLEI